MEKHILELEASHGVFDDGISLEDKALELAIEDTYEASGRKWKPWAKNARSLRIGDIILLVDSDTIVPEASIGYQSGRCDANKRLLGLFQRCSTRVGRMS